MKDFFIYFGYTLYSNCICWCHDINYDYDYVVLCYSIFDYISSPTMFFINERWFSAQLTIPESR